MKRIVVSTFLVFSVFGLIFAQSSDEDDQISDPPVPIAAPADAVQTPQAVNPVQTPTAARTSPNAQTPAAVQTPPKAQTPVAKPAAKTASRPTQAAPRQTQQSQTATRQAQSAAQIARIAAQQAQAAAQQAQAAAQQAQQAQTTPRQARQPQTVNVQPQTVNVQAQQSVQAQEPHWPNPQTSYQPRTSPPPRDTVYIVPGPPRRIISGILGISRGMISLRDEKGVVWYVLGLDRFIGFIDGLDLGEEVELEGYAPAVPGSSQDRFFQATRLILGDMDYDLAPLPEGGRVTVRPRKEIIIPPPPPVWKHNHISAWSPHYDLWLQELDTSAIWKEDTKQNKQPNKKW